MIHLTRLKTLTKAVASLNKCIIKTLQLSKSFPFLFFSSYLILLFVNACVYRLVPEIVRHYHHSGDTYVEPEVREMLTGQQTTEFLHLLNPKNYKFLPPQYSTAIR